MAYVDHRQVEAMKGNQGGGRGWHFPAQSTNQSNGRGYAFDRMIDESPLWIRVLAEIVRPRSLVMLAVIGFVSSLFWF